MTGSRGDAPELSVVVPVFCAAQFVEERLRVLCTALDALEVPYEVIAVDDASSDDSAERIAALENPALRLLRRPRNEGKFACIAAGMAESRGRYCLFTDADVPYDLAIVPEMLRAIRDRGAHVVIGDRNLPGSAYAEHLHPLRALATRIFTGFVRLFVTRGLADTQCGIKAFRGDVARALFPLLRERGFAGDVELLYVALRSGLVIERLPARLVFQGPSTVRPARDGLAMLRTIASLRGRYRAGAYASPALAEWAAEAAERRGGDPVRSRARD